MKSIGEWAFFGCSDLTEVISLIEEPFTINTYSFRYNNSETEGYDFTTATLRVPAGAKAKYEATEGWNKFTTIEEIPDVSITLDKDLVTFANNLKLDFTTPIEGLKAYVVSEVNDGKAVLKEVTEPVPAETGLILRGTAGQTYKIPYTIGAIDAVDNKLVGVTVDTAIGGNDVDYILQDGKFVKANAGMLKAGKAYLKLDAALAREVIEIDGITTGIAPMHNAQCTMHNGAGTVYNLNGQRVANPTKGLYIVDGKKVIKN